MSRFSRPAWLTTGLLIGVIAVPAVSVAATATYVSISANGRVAAVSPYGQLRTTAMDPGYSVHLYGSAISGVCTDLGALSTTHTVVVTQLNTGMYALPTTASHGELYLRTGPACAGQIIAHQDDSTLDNASSPLDPGVTLPRGTHLSARAEDGSFDVDVYGYQAVAGVAAPATSAQMLRNAGPTVTSGAKKH